ncbi:putative quinol monooxygenase [Apibacter sp. HY039]|uniref:putative quinol monooxygenase n=1 Tax=Apibacter sp. HY039 TaxID=2501476 RepID=UPI000FEBDC2D|nr:antibiotic biosynthesis monooxygenase [Apibacter sp. HY039]
MKTILLIISVIMSSLAYSQNNDHPILRISELEIYPEYLSQYKIILKEESAASVKLEKGVISIFPLYMKEDSTQFRILEIYANKAEYEKHLKTEHFIKYKTSTLKMVKSLKLVDMYALDETMMNILFKKYPYQN